VAAAILVDPSDRHSAHELRRAAHVRTRVLHAMLDRMLEDDWVTEEWQTRGEPAGRPRRYYRLTKLGRLELRALLANR
jgi:DNA-binding PadR family transcriptional regulator